MVRQQNQLEKEMVSKLKEKEVGFQLKESELNSTIKLKDNEIKYKDSHLKVQLDIVMLLSKVYVCLTNILSYYQLVKNIATARLKEQSNMYIQNVQLKQKTQDVLNQKDIERRYALTEQRKKTSSLLQKKQEVIQHQRGQIKDYQELAFDVSVEHKEMSKATRSNT